MNATPRGCKRENEIKPGIIPQDILCSDALMHSSLPTSRELWGALLFVDVKDFTRITEFANSKGHYGIEIITGVLNNYFEHLAKLVYAQGGYIAKYGGDSCLSVFPYLADEVGISRLCTGIDELCRKLDQEYKAQYGFGFAIHGGVSFCEFSINLVGDLRYHADYFISSNALMILYQQVESAEVKGILTPVWDLPQELPASVQHHITPSTATAFLPAAVTQKMQQEDYPAELRNAAVLFINLIPSNGSMITLDDYQHFFTRVQRWVYEFGGVINKIDLTDKGYLIIVLFGVPEVHVDDVERAFLCALRIVQIPFDKVKCRIGVTSSNIYCGVIGSSLRYEYGIIGNAVNIAARLMSKAEPGQIALSQEIVPAISSRFETRYVESATVKGIKEPIQVYLLVNELPEHWAFFNNKFRGLPFILDPMQQDELRQFVNQEDPALLIINGRKGTGKSYLIWLLSTMIEQSGQKAEISLVDRGGQNFRLEFFFNLVRRKMGIRSFRNEFILVSELARQQHLEWNDHLVQRYLFPEREDGVALTKEETDLAGVCLTAMCEHLLTDCNILMIDNFDLYDRDSHTILNNLITGFLASGKKVVVSGDAQALLKIPPGFETKTLALQNFGNAQSENFINSQLPLTTQPARTMFFRISNGNPQFLNGLVQQVKAHYDYGSDLVSADTLASLQARGLVSTSLENMLMASFETLQPKEKQLLKHAAIFGRQFSASELCKTFAYALDFPLEGVIAQLVKELHLELDMRGGEAVYCFANPLFQESIYRSVLLGEKREAHLQIASTLAAKQDFDDEDLQSIVFHYLQAESRAEIVKWSALAASRFFHAGAWDVSRKYFNLLSRWATDPEQALEARLKLAEICLIQADNPQAKEILNDLHPLNELQYEKSIYLNAVYLNNTAEYARLQEFLGSKLGELRDPELKTLLNVFYLESLLFSNDLLRFFQSALALFPKLRSNKRVQNRLAGVIAQAYMNQGEYPKAHRYYEKKKSLAKELHDGLGLRIAENGMGAACFRMGHKQIAWEHYQRALTIAEQYGDRNGYSKVLLNIGAFYRGEMRYDEAYECYQKSLLLAQKMGNLQQVSILVYDMGELMYYQNKYDQALALFQESLAVSEKINDYSGISFCNDAIGDICFRRGDLELAEKTYRINLTLQQKLHDQEGMAHTWGNLGNCEKARKNYSQARKFYYMQYRMLSKVQDWDGAGRSRFNLAMVNREQNMLRRALRQLENAHRLFTRCGAQYYIQICEDQRREIVELIGSHLA